MYEYYDVTFKYKCSVEAGRIVILELIRCGLCSPRYMLHDNYFVMNVGLNTYGVLMTNSIKNETNTFAFDWFHSMLLYNSFLRALTRYSVFRNN